MAAYTNAQITADAVQQYLDEQKEEGKLTIGKLHKLMNLDLDDPDNELSGYMSAGSKNALVISVDADIKTGQLEKLIYQDKWVKVRVTVWPYKRNNRSGFKGFPALRHSRLVSGDPFYICRSMDAGRSKAYGDYIYYHVPYLWRRRPSSPDRKMV